MFDRRWLFRLLTLALCVGWAHFVVSQLAYRQPEWYLPVGDNCRLFVQEFGRGPTVVVLHGGFGAEHGYLIDAFKGLDQHFHLVFYDQRGSLRSPCPANQISVENHVEDLDKLRAALGEERINIVGHSMGTFLAQDYLQQHPDRVGALVLLGTPGPKTASTEEEKALWKKQELAGKEFMDRPEVMAELRREGLDKEDRFLSPKQVTNAWRIHFAGVNLYHVDRWRDLKGGRVFYSREAAAAASSTMPSEYDFTAALAAHRCPIWVINGDHDYADPGALKFKLVAQRIPNLHFVILKDAGHVSWIDAPEAFERAVDNALESGVKCH